MKKLTTKKYSQNNMSFTPFKGSNLYVQFPNFILSNPYRFAKKCKHPSKKTSDKKSSST